MQLALHFIVTSKVHFKTKLFLLHNWIKFVFAAGLELSVLIILKLSYFGKTIREKWKFYKFLVHGIKKVIRDSRIMNPYFRLCVAYSSSSLLVYYKRKSWEVSLQVSFGLFLWLITRIIEVHLRHFWSTFEYLSIFNEYNKKQ